MELKNPNALSIYGLFIQIERHCWLMKVLRRTKKLGFDGIKETQSISVYELFIQIERKL